MKDFDTNSELIAKFLAGESTLAEKEELFAWTKKDQANQQFFEEMEQVWNMTDGADISPFEADLDTAWNNINGSTIGNRELGVSSRLSSQTSAKIIPLSKRVMRWSIAAAILLFAGFGLWWMMQPPPAPMLVEFRTLENEKEEITLPDGSKVWLNENSKLAYFENFKPRNIDLTGEAFFDVQRMEENPFIISSGKATTTVLGTSFNVRAYPQEEKIEVTVETGTVALAIKKKVAASEAIGEEPKDALDKTIEESIELKAGTSGVVHKKEEKVEKVEEKIQNAIAWKTLKLDFEDTPMEEVVFVLKRYFGTDIKVVNKAIAKCPYTATFDQPDLEGILSIIGASVGFEAEKEGNVYVLKGGGCLPEN